VGRYNKQYFKKTEKEQQFLGIKAFLKCTGTIPGVTPLNTNTSGNP